MIYSLNSRVTSVPIHCDINISLLGLLSGGEFFNLSGLLTLMSEFQAVISVECQISQNTVVDVTGHLIFLTVFLSLCVMIILSARSSGISQPFNTRVLAFCGITFI